MNRRSITPSLAASLPRVLLLLGTAMTLGACADSTPPPKAPAPPAPASVPPPAPVAADPPPVVDGDVTFATVRGMQILVDRVAGAEFTAGDLFVRGGVRNWSGDNAGIESIALRVAGSGGTTSLAKEPFTRKLASLGASIDPDAGNDFAVISASSPAASWDATFALLADVFENPALPAAEFEAERQRQLSQLRHEEEDGDGRLWLLARRSVFAGHPYANRATGTVETLGRMKLEDLAPHLAKLRDTNRLLLVVVGDVDAAHVIDQARAAFAGVPRGSYVETPIPTLHFSSPHVTGDPFKLPTNYIQSMFAGPLWTDPDFVPMWMAMEVLQWREWEEVRTKRNLSYAPGAYFNYGFAAPFGVLYVTAVDPTATMKVMTDEARRLQTDLLPPKELAGFRSLFVTTYAEAQETSEGLARRLGHAQLDGGDWHLAKVFIDRARKVTAEDIRAVSKKYIANLQTAIVGDPSKLDPKVVGAQ